MRAIFYPHARGNAAPVAFRCSATQRPRYVFSFGVWLCLGSLATPASAADYRDEVGYTQLQAALKAHLPDGRGIGIAQVEAPVKSKPEFWRYGAAGTWWPDPDDIEFKGKQLNYGSSREEGSASGHANGVARLFYGGHTAMAFAVSSIDLYSATDWTQSVMRTGSPLFPAQMPARVVNHSWVGSAGSDIYDAELLRRLDWSINTDRSVHVVGVANGNPSPPLLGNAFNVIAVGRSDGGNGFGTREIDGVYREGRAMPQIVAPMNTTSAATPIVASAAVLLINAAQRWPTFSKGAQRTLDGGLLRDSERPEVIKALLMAGARRDFPSGESRSDYRANVENRTNNGLDRRFGAGEVNILNSFAILSGGEQRSVEDTGKGNTSISAYGYDFDNDFGGADGSNSVANYSFHVKRARTLSATLTWNARIATGGTSYSAFDVEAQLYDLDLELYDDTEARRVAASTSWADNTENVWVTLVAGHDYRLVVRKADGEADFSWRYALAWRIDAGD
ncbi:MAG: S8 family serine peptidase [Gammaproteobacteria bacterium]